MAKLWRREDPDIKLSLPAVQPGEKTTSGASPEPRGSMWLLLRDILLVVIAFFALFFGARWMYHTLFNRDKSQSPSTAGTSSTNKASSDNKATTPTTTQPQSGSSESTTKKNSGSSQPAPKPTPSSPSGSAAQTQRKATQPTTPAPHATRLANTGPGETLTIFLGSSIVGYIAHFARHRKLSAKN